MRKCKGGMRGSKLSTQRFILWLVSHKGTPKSMLSKHSRRVSLHSNQLSSVNTITVTLIPFSTKELHQEGWGYPCPPHKVVDAAPHQVGGSMTCRRAFKAPRCRRTKIFFGSQENHSTKAQGLAISLTKS